MKARVIVLLICCTFAQTILSDVKLAGEIIGGIYYKFEGNNAIVSGMYGECSVCFGPPEAAKPSGHVVIPEEVKGCTVTGIDKWAFSTCKEMTSITLPNTIKWINMNAFRFSGLRSITIPKSVEFVSGEAFYGCDSLREVTILSGETKFSGSFKGTNITKLNICHTGNIDTSEFIDSRDTLKEVVYLEGSTSVGMFLQNMSKLERVTLPNTIETIPGYALKLCKKLSSITLPLSLKTIGPGAFQECGLTSITIPESVEEIGELAFAENENLSEIILHCPMSVFKDNKGTKNRSFSHCSNVKKMSVISPNGYALADLFDPGEPENCFSNLEELYYLKGSETVEIGGANTLYPMPKLNSLYLDDNITKIEAAAFYKCESLKSVRLPYSLNTLGSSVFCESGLEAIEFRSPYLTTIEARTCQNSNNLKKVILGESINKILDDAFSGCKGITTIYSMPTQNAPECINHPFEEVCRENTLYIRNSAANTYVKAPVWEEFVATNTVGLFEIKNTTAAENSVQVEPSNDEVSMTFSKTEGATKYNVGLTSSNREVNYPIYEDFTKNQIPSRRLRSSLVPGYLFTIYGLALNTEYSYRITAYDENEEVLSEYIGTFVTNDKGNNGETEDDDIVDNPQYCGANLTWSVNNGVLKIVGYGDMWDFAIGASPWGTKISAIHLSDGITHIGNHAFMACDKVSQVSIPNSVVSIGKYAFGYCTTLHDLSIGHGVASIGDYAFMECSGLNTLVLPSCLTSFGQSAFYGCSGLTSVTSYATIPPVYTGMTKNISFWNVVCQKIPLFVPAESIEDYKMANEWKLFANILPINIPETIGNVNRDENVPRKYLRNGHVIIERGSNRYTITGEKIH